MYFIVQTKRNENSRIIAVENALEIDFRSVWGYEMETDRITNPIKAIRAYCLECCLDQSNEVKLCPAEGCPLYPFRMGKNPFRKKRVMTEEQKAAAAENLRNARKT